MYQVADRHPGYGPPWEPLPTRYVFRSYFRWDTPVDMRLAETDCVYQMIASTNGVSYDCGHLYLMP
jgi:hypothetical protein